MGTNNFPPQNILWDKHGIVSVHPSCISLRFYQEKFNESQTGSKILEDECGSTDVEYLYK